jgi:uncharacterized protein (TIGR02099 family)
VAGLGLLALRWMVLPQLPRWRPEVERIASRELGQPLSINKLDADWDGLRPRIRISGLVLKDSAGHAALRLDHVDASLGWSSLILGRLRLHRLVIAKPDLDIRREADGSLHVAGLTVGTKGGSGDFAQTLFDQRTLIVDDARVRWTDKQRGAPPLVFERVAFRLENSGSRHRFGLRAEPPKALASPLDLRGDFELARGEAFLRAHGSLYASIDYADLDRWQSWIAMPVSFQRGLGGLRVWLGVARGGDVESVAADLALRDLAVRFSPELARIDLARLTGRLRYVRSGKGWQLDGHEITLATSDGADMTSTDFQVRHSRVRGRRDQNEFLASNLDIGMLAGLATRLPFPPAWRERLIAQAPRGHFPQLELSWTDGEGSPANYRIDARFDALGMAAVGILPGGRGWSGRLVGDEKGGRYQLNVAKGVLSLPAVFDEADVPLDEASFAGDWSVEKGEVAVRLGRANFRNRDARGAARGVYHSRHGGAGELDLDARVESAQASSAWRYVPRIVSGDVPRWLKAALQSGHVEGARVRLAGNLDRFPFRDGRGEFRVSGRFHDLSMAYAPGWPALEGLEGDLLFDRAKMEISAERGSVMGSRLASVHAVIPDLELGRLSVEGKAQGTTAGFLRFVNASPVANSVGYFTRGVQASGDGALDLKIEVPLANAEKASAHGVFRFEHNRLSLQPRLPELTDATGRFEFTDSAFNIPEATALWMGAPLSVRGRTRADGAVEINAQGSLQARALASLHPSALWDRVSGGAPATATLLIREHDVDLKLESSLKGFASSLPEPLNKSGVEVKPLRIGVQWRGQGVRSTETLGAEIAGAAHLQLVRDGEGRLLRGTLALGEAEASLPSKGLNVKVVVPRLDVDAWRRAAGTGDETGLLPDSVDVNVGELRVEGLKLERQGLRADREGQRWTVRLVGASAMGDLSWDGSGARSLRGRLTRLSLKPAPAARSGSAAQASRREAEPWPSVDLAVDSFGLSEYELGALRLKGHPKGRDWLLDQLTLSSQDGHIDAHGESLAGEGVSRLHFTLEALDAGSLLARLGYPGALRRGTAHAEGDLEWRGGLTHVDYPSLSGALALQAARGQFSKIDPGVGRLLGVLSLQSLARRVKLDFRDVFSEGFAFDNIAATMKIRRGVLQTQDLALIGPAARVAMRGSADLAAETQNLQVTVQPTLSESVAVGAALGSAAINPLIGIAAYVAQKMLRDPVEKLFSYEYHVTGSWSEPLSRKHSSPAAWPGKTPKMP